MNIKLTFKSIYQCRCEEFCRCHQWNIFCCTLFCFLTYSRLCWYTVFLLCYAEINEIEEEPSVHQKNITHYQPLFHIGYKHNLENKAKNSPVFMECGDQKLKKH